MANNYYTLEEISKNNGKNGEKTWIIIKDSVYNVTPYMEEHPGGSDLLLEWAGKDGTKAFYDHGHSGDAIKELKKYKIGEVVEDERKTNKKQKTKEKGANEKDNIPKALEVMEIEGKTRRSCMEIITCGLIAI